MRTLAASWHAETDTTTDSEDLGSDCSDSYEHMPDEQVRLCLTQKMFKTMISRQHIVNPRIQTDSVYGQMIAMPQVARSAGWSKELVSLTIKTMICYAVNCFIVVFLLVMIQKEERVWDNFAGQMHLCDFGAFIERCPEGPSCDGPGGTKYRPAELYSWTAWTERMFVKDSLLAVFPDRSSEISELVDPGEYGLEDYWCRLTACFVFMLVIMDEFLQMARSAALLYHLPSKAEPWITYEGPLPTDISTEPPEISDFKLKIAGMSRAWKFVNCLFVLLPWGMILKLTIQSGIAFLMDTAGIEDVIVNCVALAFILTIDETVFAHLSDRAGKAIMEDLEHFDPPKPDVDVTVWFMLFPTRLFSLCLVFTIALADYYFRHCTLPQGESWLGGFISIPIYQPSSTYINVIEAFFPCFFGETGNSSKPLWTMPETKDLN